MNHSEIVSFLWGVADLIRDTFKRGKYQDVILPLTVLRRVDCVLAPTKAQVLATAAKYSARLDNPEPLLRKAAGFAFYNTSPFDFERLLVTCPPEIGPGVKEQWTFSRRRRVMSRKRFQPEEIIGKLRHADVLLGQGEKVAEIVKALGITDVTDSRWRQEFGGMTTAQAKRLKALERENGQLRKVVADLTLDKLILQEAAKGNC